MWTLMRTQPNDPKLSDGGGWRGSCAAGARRRQEAGAVTAVAVRCSAWLGDFLVRLDAMFSISFKVGNATLFSDLEVECRRVLV